MADFNENQNGVFGGVQFNGNNNGTENTSYFEGSMPKENAGNVFGSFEAENAAADKGINFEPIQKDKAVTKPSLWTKIRAFLFQEIDLNAPIKVELTPYQQKVENEINDFLHQEITFKGIANFFKGKK